MTISFSDFIVQFTTNLPFTITVILTLAVIFVNGWTDSPNAIASCVSTRAIHPRKAILMAAVFDFLGVVVMTAFNAKVAETIYNMVDFGGDAHSALVALCAAMVAIVTWAVAAWFFGIPTSESHALIAGITGAAIALHGSFRAVNGQEWVKVIYGLVLSSVLGFGIGYVIAKIITVLCRGIERRKTLRFFRNAQICGGAAMAFMHGAQDGQKFIGVFLLGAFLAKGNPNVESFSIPLWLMLLCSLTMGLGTSIGGYRIIKAVGMDMVKLEPYQGFCADSAGAICLLISTLLSLPVSTTQCKTTAVMGVGAAKRLTSVNWGIVKEMILTWVLTFPGAGLIGFLMARAFMQIF